MILDSNAYKKAGIIVPISRKVIPAYINIKQLAAL